MDSFLHLAIMNKATKNSHIKIFMWIVFTSLWYIPGNKIAVSLGKFIFTIRTSCGSVFKSDCIIFTFSSAKCEGFSLSASSPAHFSVYHFSYSHSSACEQSFNCGFNLHSSNYKWCWTYFHIPNSHVFWYTY